MEIYNNNLTSDNTNIKKSRGCILGGLFGIIIISMLTFSLIFLFVGISAIFADKGKEKRCTESVTAIVTKNVSYKETHKKKKSRVRHTHYIYAPVYKYTYNEKEYITEGNNRTNPAKYNIDDTAVIMVNPDNPEDIYEPEFKETSKNSIFFIIVGGVMLSGDLVILLIIIFLIKKYKNQQRNNINLLLSEENYKE